jgi:ferredoxin
MRVKVDEDRCQGHAMCTLACPELFLLNDDDGHAHVEDELVPAGFEENVRQAQRGCPEAAIIVIED